MDDNKPVKTEPIFAPNSYRVIGHRLKEPLRFHSPGAPVSLPPELIELARRWPYGTTAKAGSDDFDGTVVGWYVTREGKPGLALQQHGRRIVHVYREAGVFREEAKP